MTNIGVLEHFPLQILSYEDLQNILSEVIENLPQVWETKVAEREWHKLATDVSGALIDAFLIGPAAKEKWLGRVSERLAYNERKRSKRALREIHVAYKMLLDRIYGAIFRHVLRRVPTAVCTSTGYLCLGNVHLSRYARVRDTEVKPALEEVMEFIYLGGPRFETQYSWQPLGDNRGDIRGRDRRRRD